MDLIGLIGAGGAAIANVATGALATSTALAISLLVPEFVIPAILAGGLVAGGVIAANSGNLVVYIQVVSIVIVGTLLTAVIAIAGLFATFVYAFSLPPS